MSPSINTALILCLVGATSSGSTREKLNQLLEDSEVGQIVKCGEAEHEIGLALRTHQARYDTCRAAQDKLIQEIAVMSRTKAQLEGLKRKRELADYARAYSLTDVNVPSQDQLLNCLEGNAQNFETSALRDLQATGCQWVSDNLRRRQNFMQQEIDVVAREYWEPYENV